MCQLVRQLFYLANVQLNQSERQKLCCITLSRVLCVSPKCEFTHFSSGLYTKKNYNFLFVLIMQEVALEEESRNIVSIRHMTSLLQ